MAGGTGLCLDARMLGHEPGAGHPERPERLRVLLDRFDGTASVRRIAAREASPDELALAHAPSLIEQIAETAGRPHVRLDPDTATSPTSYEAARLATGGLLATCEAVLAGDVANGFAIVRPPGHHAEYDRAMGFCLFNNVAVAARWLRRRGVARVAVVDWDLHHGNGTQHLFAADPDVLYVSTHQYPYYPGTGAAEEVGDGPGAGRTLNVPFPFGTGDEEFARAFDEVVLPVLRQFAPEFVLVSAGFDCDARDPLGGLEVTPAGIAHMARTLVELAGETARGRIVGVLEGGYDLGALVDGVETVLAAFAGRSEASPLQSGDGRLAERVLARVRAAQAPFWQF